MNCRQIESCLPPFVDGDIDPALAAQVHTHLHGCPACSADAAALRAVRELVTARASALRPAAPPALRDRVAAALGAEAARDRVVNGAVDRRLSPVGRFSALAAAAALVLATLVTVELVPMPTAVLYAAQVALDHVRCLYIEAGTIEPEPGASLDEAVREQYGWDVRLAPASAEHQLVLRGVRRCPLGLGPHAHVLYRAAGQDVSLYIMPDGERGDHDGDSLGFHEHVWSANGRTYAMVSSGLAPERLAALADYFRAETR